MSEIELAIFWLGWVLATASPGPATLSIISCAMNNGRWPAISQALGTLTGGAFWGITAATGMGALMLTNVWLFEILRYVGAFYLLYLALKSIKKVISSSGIQLPAATQSNKRHLYFRGLLINLTNPKAILQWGALYAVVVPLDAEVSYIMSIFGVLFLGGVIVYISYAVLFSNSKLVNIYSEFSKFIEAGFALFFGFAGFKVLTSKLE